MTNHRSLLFIVILSLWLLTGACGTLNLAVEGAGDEADQATAPSATPTSLPSAVETPSAGSSSEDSSGSATTLQRFEELGISLEVPNDLHVTKEPVVNLDDPSRLDAYLFYIQNYGGNEGPGADYFQMYGHLQYGLPPESWEDFSLVQNNTTEYAYINPIEINGARGFEGQFSGTRNRFIYLFYLDGRVLTIAVADPTPENKVLADEIIQTFQLLPLGLSDASGVVPVVDPGGAFTVLLPEDWSYSFNPTAGIRLAELEASSPGAAMRVDDVNGPHSNIYYQSGVFMSLVVLEDDSATLEPPMATIENRQTVYFNGVEGSDYTFVEPSTVEGTLREVRVYHAGRSYLLRFGFADDANQDDLDRIIRSLTLGE
jgi:hypothetical protein